jgi:hypothetical protein
MLNTREIRAKPGPILSFHFMRAVDSMMYVTSNTCFVVDSVAAWFKEDDGFT